MPSADIDSWVGGSYWTNTFDTVTQREIASPRVNMSHIEQVHISIGADVHQIFTDGNMAGKVLADFSAHFLIASKVSNPVTLQIFSLDGSVSVMTHLIVATLFECIAKPRSR